MTELVADSRRLPLGTGETARRDVGDAETDADAEEDRCVLLLVGERERESGESGGEVGVGYEEPFDSAEEGRE